MTENRMTIDSITNSPLKILQNGWFTNIAEHFENAIIKETFEENQRADPNDKINADDDIHRQYYNHYLTLLVDSLKRLGKESEAFKETVDDRFASYQKEQNKDKPEKEKVAKKGYKLVKEIHTRLKKLADELSEATKPNASSDDPMPNPMPNPMPSDDPSLMRAELNALDNLLYRASEVPKLSTGINSFIDIGYKIVALASVQTLKPVVIKINKAILQLVAILQGDLSTLNTFLLVFNNTYIINFNNGQCLDDNDRLKRALELMIGTNVTPDKDDVFDPVPGANNKEEKANIPPLENIVSEPSTLQAPAARAEKNSIASNLLAYLR